MIYIKKSTEPQSYRAFLNDNRKLIKTKINNHRQTGVKIWNWFKQRANGVLDDLRLKLLEDQGYVCCYCGEKITNSSMAIEHLEPKNIKSNIFPFSNLYASCIGGKEKTHNIGRNESLATLSTRFNISISKLQKLNPGKSFVHKDCIKIYKSDTNGSHCDNKKNGDFLINKPDQLDIFDKIKYQFDASKKEVSVLPVNLLDIDLENDINTVLQLNQKTLKKRRAIVLNQVNSILDDIIDQAGSDEDIVTGVVNLFEDYETKKNGKFDPFYFVCMSYINELDLSHFN
ncbi:hypothetical protein DMA11_07810 [Marinilabiliaceae bacterium JC017]|nr:hypothetical protein DMA11_07810 [Marinilabiliaceae bacterium JC017]